MDINDKKEFQNATKDIKKKITDLWSPLGIVLGVITAITQFIQLWRGNQEIFTQIFGLGGILLIWVSLYHVGFSTFKLPFEIKRFGKNIAKKNYKYGNIATISRYLFFLSVLGGIVLWGLTIHQRDQLENKVIVLIADFDGPDIKKYQVTQKMFYELSSSFSSYDDIEIIPLNKVILEQEGSEFAQNLGKQYQADLVIWGWYGVTDSDVMMTVHVENLLDIDYLFMPTSNSYGSQLPVHEIKNFTIQQKLSSEVTALTLFLGGMIQFEANNYEEAIIRLSQAIDEQWPDELTSKAYIHYFRGLSYFYSFYDSLDDETHLQNSIDDFSKTLSFSPSFVFANYQRALSYIFLQDYENARKDYLVLMNTEPESFFSYEELGYLSSMVAEVEKAVEYFSLAIENNPEDFMLFYNRGILYAHPLNDYSKSIDDLNQVIKFIPDSWLGYSGRADTFFYMEEYKKAIQDYNRATELLASEENMDSVRYFDYYRRGYSYLQIGEYEEAIEDITLSLENNEGVLGFFVLPEKYYARGMAFERSGDVENAFVDYALSAQAYATLYSKGGFFYNLYVFEGADSKASSDDKCGIAIRAFKELSQDSQNISVIRFANAVDEAFQENCPDSLPETFLVKIPEETWIVRMSNNPIIPNVGLAGIEIGDSAQSVEEKLDKPVTWFGTTTSEVDDCCDIAVGVWVSHDGLMLYIFFSMPDEKVAYIRVQGASEHSMYVPMFNHTTMGTATEEMFANFGDTDSYTITENSETLCYPYQGIVFCAAEEKLINDIWIPRDLE